MPIIELQRRLHEIGRIRTGEKKVSKNGKSYPAKLATFRLTSQDAQAVNNAAALFGGKPQRWADAPAGDQYEVVTDTASLDVIVPPGGMAFSQWYEAWSKGGCQKRCDGNWNVIADAACSCDPSERECKAHTRLSVILRDMPGLGVWRLDTQSYYGAAELAGAVEVCQMASERGQMLPARLRLEQRTVKRIVAGEPTTMNFAVPVLDVDLPMGALAAGRTVDAATGEIAAPRFKPVPVAELAEGPRPSVAEQMATVAEPAVKKPRKNAATPIPPSGRKPRTAVEAAQGPAPRETVEDTAGESRAAVSDTADQWDKKGVTTRIDGLDLEHKAMLKAAWSEAGWAPLNKLPETDVTGVLTLIGRIEDQQQATHDKRRKHANAVMGEVGVKSDDARHDLVREATGGQTESTAHLTEAHLAGIVDYCDGLKAMDEGGAA